MINDLLSPAKNEVYSNIGYIYYNDLKLRLLNVTETLIPSELFAYSFHAVARDLSPPFFPLLPIMIDPLFVIIILLDIMRSFKPPCIEDDIISEELICT